MAGEWLYATSVQFRLGDSFVINATGLSNAKDEELIQRWLDFLMDNIVLLPPEKP